jgi:3-phosphoshikimate 1-carboxyvinyltransferase
LDITITNNIPSAQVKSAIILKAISSQSNCRLIDEYKSRNHTELMAISSGANLKVKDDEIILQPSKISLPQNFTVYNDPSSAFFIAAAAILSNQDIVIKDVYLNPTRTGAFKALEKMGADVSYKNQKTYFNEEVGDIHISPKELNAITIDEKSIPTLIDEIPMLAILCCFAKGCSKICGLEELKHKESDRLELIYKNLSRLGANIKILDNNLTISTSKLNGGELIDTHNDHRIVMAFEVLNLVMEKKNIIKDKKCVKISFPNFYEEIDKLSKHEAV